MQSRILITILLLISATALADISVKLDSRRDNVNVIHGDIVVTVQRIQDTEHRIEGSYAKTSRKCPPDCIQPVEAIAGVKTIGEYEIFNFMENELVSGDGFIIDTRAPSWFQKGTIPGSINIPVSIIEMDIENTEIKNVLDKLGIRKRLEVSSFTRFMEKWGFLNGDLKNDHWDFTQAKNIILWSNGMWSDESPRAIKALTNIGYPKDRISYYRGGMQAWQVLGLTTIKP